MRSHVFHDSCVDRSRCLFWLRWRLHDDFMVLYALYARSWLSTVLPWAFMGSHGYLMEVYAPSWCFHGALMDSRGAFMEVIYTLS